MQSRTLALGFLLTLLAATAVVAGARAHGPDHDHASAPVDEATAKKLAAQHVAELVRKDKLEDSWGSIKASSAKKKAFKSRVEWVVVFLNEKAVDEKKKKLYVFLTLSGKYVAANYTGK